MTAEIKVAYDERGIPYLFEATGKEAVNVNKALEKQIPKKPNEHIATEGAKTLYFCPECGYGIGNWMNNCSQCGQAIDWSETE